MLVSSKITSQIAIVLKIIYISNQLKLKNNSLVKTLAKIYSLFERLKYLPPSAYSLIVFYASILSKKILNLLIEIYLTNLNQKKKHAYYHLSMQLHK